MFYGFEPFDTAEVTYVWTGLGTPGFFAVTVKGQAPQFTSNIQLVRDPDFVGGLAINVMGWTGPLASPPTTSPYTVSHSFNGAYVPRVVIVGANKREVVEVKQIPAEQAEDYMKANAV